MTIGRAQAVLFAVLLLCWAVSSHAEKYGDEEREKMTDSQILLVLEKNRGKLMGLPGVVGIAEGRCNGKPCIKVYITKKSPNLTRRIPSHIEGIPVSTEVTGEFKSLQEKESTL